MTPLGVSFYLNGLGIMDVLHNLLNETDLAPAKNVIHPQMYRCVQRAAAFV